MVGALCFLLVDNRHPLEGNVDSGTEVGI
jgi:hypothetical protein